MILGFSQVINGMPTQFIEKTWQSLIETKTATQLAYIQYGKAYEKKFSKLWDGYGKTLKSKKHTIRALRKNENGDLSDLQWKVGHNINFAINNRTPLYFQFAPVVQVKSKQRVFMTFSETEGFQVSIDSIELSDWEIEMLAINDGFENVDDFENYFLEAMEESQEFEGVLIHWTDLKYLGNGQGTN